MKDVLDNNDYFNNMDLNSDMKSIYDLIDDVNIKAEFEKLERITQIRNDNYNRYVDIDILRFEDLSSEFKDIIIEIERLYYSIDHKNILTERLPEAQNTNKIINHIYMNINRLERMIKTALNELREENDEKQKKYSLNYFNALDSDKALKKELIKIYNTLVIESSKMSKDIYEEIKFEYNRKNYIKEIELLISREEDKQINSNNQDKLNELNKLIDIEIKKHKEKITYLEDLIPENSKHINEFNEFKAFCNKIIAYDDTNYSNAKQTYEILSDEDRFNTYLKNFEVLFINEIENNRKEESFVFEKVGVKNLIKSLNYIAANYMDKLEEPDRTTINYIYEQLNNKKYNLVELEMILSNIVNKIWNKTITDVKLFNNNEDYYFICSNNQFIDEKYETILLTRKEINRVNDYHDYQIGFICDYNDNILYMTENDDIMSVDYDDMSKLKTPLQIEQEFINFEVCNKIALNGYKTKISAVYIIDDGNINAYRKALELSSMYNLPLIKLKKDN